MSNRNTIFSQLDYEMLLEAYITAGDLRIALTVLVVMEEAGVQADSNTANPIVSYLRQGRSRPMEAFNILEEFAQAQRKVPAAAINAIIQTCVAMADLEQAIEVYKSLHTICPKGPNVETFNTLFQGCRTARRKELAMFFAAEMIQLKIQPNLLTYDRLVLVCGECGDIDDAFRYYEEMRDQGWHPRDGTYSQLIQMCAHYKDERAYAVLDDMKRLELPLWRPLAILDKAGMRPGGSALGANAAGKTAGEQPLLEGFYEKVAASI
jgi:pentatricopeptide repeat protein